jgi:3-hydroxyisobutyrate dehydrogenase-like beta-hydroxyacid dehydrogenase
MNRSTTPVAVLGLGIIGSRVASHLDRAGHPTVLWSRTGRIASTCQSPQEAAEKAKTIQMFLRDDAATLDAMRSMAPILSADHIVLNHATISKQATLEVASICHERGAAFLDAPFTGSKMAAENAKLCYYIGGAGEILERARPILEVSSAKILHLGAIGDAMVLKIATNLVTSVTVKALCEAAAIASAEGVSLQALKTAFESNANYSPLIGMKLSGIIEEDFSPHFSLVNMLKDIDFALELASQSKIKAPAATCTAEALRKGLEQKRGEEDFSVIAKINE